MSSRSTVSTERRVMVLARDDADALLLLELGLALASDVADSTSTCHQPPSGPTRLDRAPRRDRQKRRDPGVEPASSSTASAKPRCRPGSTGTPSQARLRQRSSHRPDGEQRLPALVGPGDAPTAAAASHDLADDQSRVPAPFSIPLPFEEHPIDLATALRLADAANPTIGAARTLVLEALANPARRAGAARFPRSMRA